MQHAVFWGGLDSETKEDWKDLGGRERGIEVMCGGKRGHCTSAEGRAKPLFCNGEACAQRLQPAVLHLLHLALASKQFVVINRLQQESSATSSEVVFPFLIKKLRNWAFLLEIQAQALEQIRHSANQAHGLERFRSAATQVQVQALQGVDASPTYSQGSKPDPGNACPPAEDHVTSWHLRI